MFQAPTKYGCPAGIMRKWRQSKEISSVVYESEQRCILTTNSRTQPFFSVELNRKFMS